jgi:hypothetical protein
MTALVVVESMFGNTRAIADAVAEGLRESVPVDVVTVADAPATVPDDVALVVVGGPTHAFGMSRPGTRESAVTQGATADPVIGVREWLEALPDRYDHLRAAAFDSRVNKAFVPGSAARGAAKRLRRLGFRLLAAPESFFVADVAGPLLPGELDRAREWGRTLAGQLPEAALADGHGPEGHGAQ